MRPHVFYWQFTVTCVYVMLNQIWYVRFQRFQCTHHAQQLSIIQSKMKIHIFRWHSCIEHPKLRFNQTNILILIGILKLVFHVNLVCNTFGTSGNTLSHNMNILNSNHFHNSSKFNQLTLLIDFYRRERLSFENICSCRQENIFSSKWLFDT